MKNNDPFRDSLLTDLGRSIYDWGPIKKHYLPPEIAQEITAAFCVREGRKCLECSFSGVVWAYVELDGKPTLDIYKMWKIAFAEHGYAPPILVFKEA